MEAAKKGKKSQGLEDSPQSLSSKKEQGTVHLSCQWQSKELNDVVVMRNTQLQREQWGEKTARAQQQLRRAIVTSHSHEQHWKTGEGAEEECSSKGSFPIFRLLALGFVRWNHPLNRKHQWRAWVWREGVSKVRSSFMCVLGFEMVWGYKWGC